MPTNRTDNPPHPDYGFPDSMRLAILRDAEAMGVKAAAEANGVSETIIYIWRKRLGPRSTDLRLVNYVQGFGRRLRRTAEEKQ